MHSKEPRASTGSRHHGLDPERGGGSAGFRFTLGGQVDKSPDWPSSWTDGQSRLQGRYTPTGLLPRKTCSRPPQRPRLSSPPAVLLTQRRPRTTGSWYNKSRAQARASSAMRATALSSQVHLRRSEMTESQRGWRGRGRRSTSGARPQFRAGYRRLCPSRVAWRLLPTSSPHLFHSLQPRWSPRHLHSHSSHRLSRQQRSPWST